MLNKSLILQQQNDQIEWSITESEVNKLNEHEVLIEAHYSSLNYKDALILKGKLIKQFPHVPGIDVSGIVVESKDKRFKKGDRVLVTGYGLGVDTPGGYQQYVTVPGDWVIKCPESLSLEEAMIYGTAGLTAALSVFELVDANIKPDDGRILVTGATGGVGSIALRLLRHLGYKVTALTGKDAVDDLIELGATAVLPRQNFLDQPNKALLKGEWVGVIDTVGGDVLATALKSTKYGGVVTSCGNAMSDQLTTSVYPFILKSVRLIGIDSVYCPYEKRQHLWNLLSASWKLPKINDYYSVIDLEEVPQVSEQLLQGIHRGRTIIKLR